MLKIIGGKYKRYKIDVPKNFVRPTSSIKREAIFSILESYALKKSIDLYNGKAVLDLYAGSGSVGLEAISRGMHMGYFIEKEREVASILEKNCIKICKDKKYKIIQNNVESSLNINFTIPISIIFVDPPYQNYDLKDILNKIVANNLNNKETLIVIETSFKKNIIIPKELKIFQNKYYRKTRILFLN